MKKNILALIQRQISKYFKVWGVKLSSPLDPEFVVTQHATERLKERFGCNENKLKKVTIKAWYSKEEPRKDKCHFSKYPGYKYKLFHGNIFVFMKKRSVPRYPKIIRQKILVTVFPYKKFIYNTCKETRREY